MTDKLTAEAESIRIGRHRAQQKRNHDATALMVAARIIREYGLGDGIALEALADRIAWEETP